MPVPESHELLALALHGAEAGTFEFDLATGENIWHSSMAALMAVPPERVREEGRDFARYLHPGDRERVVDDFQRYIAQAREGRVWENDFRVIRGDGQVRWLTTRGTTVRRASGLSMIGIAQDITARKEAEHRLRESEQRFRLLADSVPIMLWMYEAGRVSFINRAYYRFLGARDDEDPGTFAWYDFVHPDDADRYLAEWSAANATGSAFQSEMRFRRHDGEFRWTINTALPRHDVSGAVVGYTGATIDIHEAKMAMAALSEADRRKTEFLAVLAHELRNPLAPVRTAIALMKRIGLEGHARGAAEVIDRQVTHMVRLIDDLLDISRITRGSLVLQMADVTVAEILELATETARPIVEGAGHRFEVAAPAPIVVHGDKVRLAQCLINLLHNASKFTEPGGVIRLGAETRGGEAHLIVHDTGYGLDEAGLAGLFDVSMRRNPGHNKGGLGLGLTLSRQLVEMHGGRIEARSEGVGKGSEFRIVLPLSTS